MWLNHKYGKNEHVYTAFVVYRDTEMELGLHPTTFTQIMWPLHKTEIYTFSYQSLSYLLHSMKGILINKGSILTLSFHICRYNFIKKDFLDLKLPHYEYIPLREGFKKITCGLYKVLLHIGFERSILRAL